MDNPNDVRRPDVYFADIGFGPEPVLREADHDRIVAALREERDTAQQKLDERMAWLELHADDVIKVKDQLAHALADGAAVLKAYRGCEGCLDACVEGPYCLACLDKQAALSKQSNPGQAMVEELKELREKVEAYELGYRGFP